MKIRNVPAYLRAAEVIEVDVPGFGPLSIDVSYWRQLLRHRRAARRLHRHRRPRPRPRSCGSARSSAPWCARPVSRSTRWTRPFAGSATCCGPTPRAPDADGPQRGVLRRPRHRPQPCGTGTSARLAHLAAKGKLKVGDAFVHESIIGSRFIGRVEAETELARPEAIIPSIEGLGDRHRPQYPLDRPRRRVLGRFPGDLNSRRPVGDGIR
ncbi:proline racemase family protein [Caulobacter segnis]